LIFKVSSCLIFLFIHLLFVFFSLCFYKTFEFEIFVKMPEINMHPSNSRNRLRQIKSPPARARLPFNMAPLLRGFDSSDPRMQSIEAEFRLNEIAPVAEQIFVRSAHVAESVQRIAVELCGHLNELEHLHLESMVDIKNQQTLNEKSRTKVE
jgi:hypothetical protein